MASTGHCYLPRMTLLQQMTVVLSITEGIAAVKACPFRMPYLQKPTSIAPTDKCVLVFIILLVLIISGTVFLVIVEKLNVIDAFYCICSTITTLGYKDKSFSTKAGRIFAIFWILVSTICFAQFFLYIAEWNTEKRPQKSVKWVLSRRMTNLDLEAVDLDNDGVIGAGEFIVYKLKEMGKVNQQDISLILQEFEELDVDLSGTLSISDLALAQSSQPEKGIRHV